MYLFTRTARLAPGRIRESLVWAADITDRVNKVGVAEVSLWTRSMSPGLGTLVWSTIVPDMLTLETLQAKLEADDSYLDVVDHGAQFIAAGSSVDDALATIVQGAPDPNVRSAYAAVVTATVVPGASFGAAVQAGIEIADQASVAGGATTIFCLSSTGPFGRVAWITPHADVEHLDAGEAAVYADAAFMELIDTKASKLYVDGESSFLRRLL